MDDYENGILDKFIKDTYPEASYHYGILVAVPCGRKITEEFNNTTPLDSDVNGWTLKTVVQSPSNLAYRERSTTELLFCMLRSCKKIERVE